MTKAGALYSEIFKASVADAEDFWSEAAKDIHWTRTWDRVLDDSDAPYYRWFSGGELNTCYNTLDLHVDEGNGDRTALIYDSAVTQARQTFSFSELRDAVATFSGVLAARGVCKGDRVIVYMPMVPEAVIAMLAATSLGAVWTSCSPDFGVNGVLDRFGQTKPKVLFTADGYHYNGRAHDSLGRVAEFTAYLPTVEKSSYCQ